MNTRRLAMDVLSDIVDGGAYANLRLKQAQAGLCDKDSRFLSALIYTTLDHLLYLDYVIDAYARQKQKKTIRALLRLGACELLFLRTPARAAVNEYVALCTQIGKGGVAGFVNAILRRIDREREAFPPLPSEYDKRLSIQYSYPLWLVQMWISERGPEETKRLLSAEYRQNTVRAQHPMTTRSLADKLESPVSNGKLDENCLYLSSGLDFASNPLFLSGQMTVQGEGAMLACRALGDCKGKAVLDVCAAPGGKSAYIASLAAGQVDLTCFELHEHRMELMQSNYWRLHVKAKTICRDATVHDATYDSIFDAVLVDAPCSGLGLLAGKPDLRYQKQASDIDSLCLTQRKILDACAPYVRNGGILVYATCTISARENEQQIADFCYRHPKFVPSPLPFSECSSIQLLPHVHGTEGFFIARMQKCI